MSEGFSALGAKSKGGEVHPDFQPGKKDIVELTPECQKHSALEKSENATMIRTNGACKPRAAYGADGSLENQRLKRACIRITYGEGVDPKTLTEEQLNNPKLWKWSVVDASKGTCKHSCCGGIFVVGKDILGCMKQHEATCPRVPQEEMTCSKCNQTAAELGLERNNESEKGHEHITNVMGKHTSFCPSNEDWDEIVAKIASKPRPGSNGRIGFKESADKALWNKIRYVTGGNKRYKPVTGKRRADLEQLGYTVENGFFP